MLQQRVLLLVIAQLLHQVHILQKVLLEAPVHHLQEVPLKALVTHQLDHQVHHLQSLPDKSVPKDKLNWLPTTEKQCTLTCLSKSGKLMERTQYSLSRILSEKVPRAFLPNTTLGHLEKQSVSRKRMSNQQQKLMNTSVCACTTPRFPSSRFGSRNATLPKFPS